MDENYLEAVLIWGAGAEKELVRRWLEQSGLTLVPMQAGWLLSGPVSLFNSVFGCDVSALGRPASLPIPAALAGHVSTIEIPRPRWPMSNV